MRECPLSGLARIADPALNLQNDRCATATVGSRNPEERNFVVSDRFDRFLPLAGVLAGLLFFVGLVLLWNDPSSETGPAETFAYWQDNHGQHQIVALLIAPLIAFLLLFFGAGLRRRLAQGNGDAGHGSVAFGGALLGAAPEAG